MISDDIVRSGMAEWFPDTAKTIVAPEVRETISLKRSLQPRAKVHFRNGLISLGIYRDEYEADGLVHFVLGFTDGEQAKRFLDRAASLLDESQWTKKK